MCNTEVQPKNILPYPAAKPSGDWWESLSVEAMEEMTATGCGWNAEVMFEPASSNGRVIWPALVRVDHREKVKPGIIEDLGGALRIWTVALGVDTCAPEAAAIARRMAWSAWWENLDIPTWDGPALMLSPRVLPR